MNSLEETNATCKEYLMNDPNVKNCCSKMTSDGFMYRYEKDGNSFLFNLILKTIKENLSLAVLIAYADVLVPPDRSEAVAMYCQRNSDPCKPGILTFSPEQHNMFYKISTPITDFPLTDQSLIWMNRCALEKLSGCRNELEGLAYGVKFKSESRSEKADADETPEFPEDNLDFSKAVIKYLLQHTRSRKEVCESLSDDDVLFFNQLVTDNGIYHEEIRVDESGCLIFRMRSDFKVRPELSALVSEYCNASSSSAVPYGLYGCSTDGYLWFATTLSLWDGFVGLSDLRHFETLGITMLEAATEVILSCTADFDPEDGIKKVSCEGLIAKTKMLLGLEEDEDTDEQAINSGSNVAENPAADDEDDSGHDPADYVYFTEGENILPF